MSTMVQSITEYLTDGCGRCSLFKTEECKVHQWTEEIQYLRYILQQTELIEEMKWGSPCYTLQGKNVLMIAVLKRKCSLSFFKGCLLKDPTSRLKKAGENSRNGRLLSFQNIQEIQEQEQEIRAFIQAAISIEQSGATIPKNTELLLVEELEQALEADPLLHKAFHALTPGRQRGYNIYISQAKQAKTRQKRIEQYKAKILAGKGFHDR